MEAWEFHVLYPFVIEKITRYSNEFPTKCEKNNPKFDGAIHFSTQHVTSFLEFVSKFNAIHEYVLIRLFVYFLEGDPKT
jgi:hypothetical protein